MMTERSTTAALPMHRIAVLNRGEPAVRFMRALREYNLERGTSLVSVAFYTDPDAEAPFVRMADEAIHLGAAMLTDASGATVNAYCHHDHVLAALTRARCDAVWPGWGFVSEDDAFVARLEDAGITFIGPSSHAMKLLGDKIASKEIAEQAGVPLAPWARLEPGASAEEILSAAGQIGYPLMVKASAGGGGRGIRKVSSPDALVVSVTQVQDEVRKVFGAGGVFLEACITGARHIEVQLVGRPQGAIALGVRDCSIQRRNQKIIEEAPSSVLPADVEKLLCESSVRLAEAAGYMSAGTAEFLYETATGRCAFLEVNSRLQVEHTVTELIRGVDLVHAQLDIARGVTWEPPTDGVRGHAIEVRLNAEDPERGFAPSPGMVRVFRPPAGPGVRVDSGIDEGMEVAPEFDSMIAKVIAWGHSRPMAIARLKRALQELQVVVEDGATNRAFLLELLDRPEVINGTADTAWIDRAMVAGEFAAPAWAFEALLMAAVIEYRLQRHASIQRFFAQVQNGIPQNLPRPEGLTIELRLRGQAASVEVYEIGRDRYLAGLPGALHAVTVEPTGAHSVALVLGDRRHNVLYSYGRAGIVVEVNGIAHPVERASGGVVRAHAPAMVVHVSVEEGEVITPGQTLCVLEAMKMETAVFAQEGGTVRAVLIQPNQQVTAGQPMIMLEPEVGDSKDSGANLNALSAPTPRPRPLDRLFESGAPSLRAFDALDDDAAAEVIEDLTEAIGTLMLGFDAPPRLVAKLERLLGPKLDLKSCAKPERWAPLASMLSAFADGEALFERTMLKGAAEGAAISVELGFYEFCRLHHEGEDGAAEELRPRLLSALAGHGVRSLDASEALRSALWRLAIGHAHAATRHRLCSSLLRAVMDLHQAGVDFQAQEEALRKTLDRVAQVANHRYPFVADNARQASYVLFDRSRYVERRQVVEAMLGQVLQALTGYSPESAEARAWMDALARSPHSLFPLLLHRADPGAAATPYVAEAIIRRLYAERRCETLDMTRREGAMTANFRVAPAEEGQDARHVLAVLGHARVPRAALMAAAEAIESPSDGCETPEIIEIALQGAYNGPALAPLLDEAIAEVPTLVRTGRLTISWCNGHDGLHHRTYHSRGGQHLEQSRLRDVHPEAARRVELWRLAEFDLDRLDAPEQIHAFRAKAHANDRDERIFIHAEVRSLSVQKDGDREGLWEFEQVFFESLRVLREAQSQRAARRRLHWNLLRIFVQPPVRLAKEALLEICERLEPATRSLGLQEVVVQARLQGEVGPPRPITLFVRKRGPQRLEIDVSSPDAARVRAMSDYEMRVVRTRKMGFFYPYEVARMLAGENVERTRSAPELIRGSFVEYDLDASGERLVSVNRPLGQNTCGIVVGIVNNVTPKFPEGVERVWIASDPTHSMCALAEPECRRVLAALELAEVRGLPVEWLPVSAGARIAMDSGTENLDWTARVLKKIVEFTQRGGEINVIVAGVNVGAQSYWNAEATMLNHTRGVLIMTPGGSMVLTGKKALEYSGGVAAEDERGIGGYERIMGPNGQAQYFAHNLGHAYKMLFQHYALTYRRPDEPSPRPFPTRDASDRSIMGFPYKARFGESFKTVGEIFDDRTNPGRKKPFAIREVMAAVIDQDGEQMERFEAMRDGETAVVWDAHMGGHSICLLGIESRPMPRYGRIPLDGPDMWTGGTLFPESSRKVARAINAASGNRPLVVLANLSGFDGSPESLRKRQLEYGAEIGRAVVNFQGPMIFVVVGRYHGGAYVVFSKALNPEIHALALEGTYASVIGGAPAAAVVFPREVRRQANADPRLIEARQQLTDAPEANKPLLRERLDALTSEIILEKQGEVARAFDAIHTVNRAVEVGSLDAVIPPGQLRPTIINQIESGLARHGRHHTRPTLRNGHAKVDNPLSPRLTVDH